MTLPKIVLVIAVAFLAWSVYTINTGLESIKRSSYNIGCMSVPNTTYSDIQKCKSMYGKERFDYERSV